MAEILQFRQTQEINKQYIGPPSYGTAGGPPGEPPFGRRKRHLSAVKPLTDEALPEVAATEDTSIGNPVSYDLDRRRRLRHISIATDRVSTQQTEPAHVTYSPPLRRRKTIQVFSPETAAPAPEKRVVFSTAKPESKDESKEFFYTKEWVEQEVGKVKKQPRNAGETPWWHLKGTGFWVQEQIGQLVRNLQGVGRDAFPNVLELELSKVGVDFAHFEREYLQQMGSLNWQLAFQERNDVKRIICPEYKGGGNDKEGALWSSVTSKKERDGEVFKTLFGTEEEAKTGIGGVEGWLKKAKPGSFAFIISPEGWSGFDGQEYPEGQNYAIQVQADGSLKAHTFRYDAVVVQNETLQRMMGLTIPESANQRERIKNTIANVALLTPEDAARLGIKGLEDFITLMQKSVGGRDVAYGEGKGLKTFDEIRAFIKNPEGFTVQHQMTEKLTNRFKDYARQRLAQGGSWKEIEVDLQIAMAFNPLHLNQAYDMKAATPKGQSFDGSFGSTTFAAGSGSHEFQVEAALILQARNGAINYNQQKDKLEEKPGCGGGGSKPKEFEIRYGLKFATSMGGSRQVEVKLSEGEGFSCPKCPFKAAADVSVGDTCPGCGLTKEEFASESAISCD